MRLSYLTQDSGNTRLILIITGWSTGPDLYRGFSVEGWDVAVAYDFSSPEIEDAFLDRYYTIYLFAWSLGVFAAEFLPRPERITEAFAINGTPLPVSDRHGIPQRIFLGTADNLSPLNLRKFRRRMAGCGDTYNRVFGDGIPGEEECADLARQLHCVAAAEPRPGRIEWTRAYISDRDLIFPPSNMKAYWSEKSPDTQVWSLGDSPHLVDIPSIIRGIVADVGKVSRRFKDAAASYDTHAIAQHSAAIHLAAMAARFNPEKGGKALEIGPGTGLFTREYGRLLQPAEVTFVDIAPTGPHAVAPKENYHQCDAERFVESDRDTYDYILSASAIQWFADIPRFLRNCASRLRPGGLLAISTFLPGNMGELDALRPSPLLYPTPELLLEALGDDFRDVTVEGDEIKVEFRSVRDMLLHLKHTGVGGSAPGVSLAALRNVRSLTYRPLYLTAIRR